MSLDGSPLRIPKDIDGPGPDMVSLGCGGFLYMGATSQFAKCTDKHVHCRRCKCVARRFRSGYICQCKEAK